MLRPAGPDEEKKQSDPGKPNRLLLPAHFIVLHHTGADTPGSTINHFSDIVNNNQTGAHYLVDTDGHVIKMAYETIMTRHAGECFWYGLDSHHESSMGTAGFSWNDISVGIEQVHRGSNDYRSEQVAGTKNLIQRIRDAHQTVAHNVLDHGQIALHRRW